MSEPKFSRRFTLGGRLAIWNGGAVVALTALARFAPDMSYTYRTALLYVFIALTVPIGWSLLLPSLHGPSREEVVIGCILAGFNSLVWGYGLAAIIRLSTAGIRRLRLRLRPETVRSDGT